MPRVPVYNTEGETVGEIELRDDVFGVPVNGPLMHQAVVTYLANQRLGTHKTKTRGEVRGGGRKPWRQKGTGRARQGSIRAPHWRKGGIVFGPRPREYRLRLPKKMRRGALKSALSAKVREGALLVLEDLRLEKPATREVLRVLRNLGVTDQKPLIVLPEVDRNVVLAARNLPGVETAVAKDLNTYIVLKHPRVVFTREAVERVTEVLSS